MKELAPVRLPGRQVIEGYGAGGFTVSGVRYDGAVLVTREATRAWPRAGLDAAALVTLAELIPPGVADVVLLGCGARTALVQARVREVLKEHGLRIEPMATDAACRTYMMLLAEDRLVAAALLPIG